jgi:hypothetical protein
MLTSGLLVFAAAAVMAQNATSPPEGTVLMPYSLQGDWATDIAVIDEFSGVVGDFTGCYTTFTGNPTGSVWQQICQEKETRAETVVATVSMTSPSVVACGQNQQLGQSYGVFGGYVAVDNNTEANQTAACVYFSRVDANHLTGAKNALANLYVYSPEPCDAANAGKVCCESPRPKDSVAPILQFKVDGAFTCASGTCLEDRWSSYCTDNTNYALKQIGIGMSVGGIALLLVTLVFIIIISRLVQG